LAQSIITRNRPKPAKNKRHNILTERVIDRFQISKIKEYKHEIAS